MTSDKPARSRVAGVASYSSAELEFWRKIATERHVLKFKADERGRVTNYRQRLYNLRLALKKEGEDLNALGLKNLDLYTLAARGILRVIPEYGEENKVVAWLLVGEPADMQTLPELEAAGFKPIQPPSLDKL